MAKTMTAKKCNGARPTPRAPQQTSMMSFWDATQNAALRDRLLAWHISDTG